MASDLQKRKLENAFDGEFTLRIRPFDGHTGKLVLIPHEQVQALRKEDSKSLGQITLGAIREHLGIASALKATASKLRFCTEEQFQLSDQSTLKDFVKASPQVCFN